MREDEFRPPQVLRVLQGLQRQQGPSPMRLDGVVHPRHQEAGQSRRGVKQHEAAAGSQQQNLKPSQPTGEAQRAQTGDSWGDI